MPGQAGAKAMRQRKAMLVNALAPWVKMQESLFEIEVPPRAAYVIVKCRPCHEALRAAERRKAKKEDQHD